MAMYYVCIYLQFHTVLHGFCRYVRIINTHMYVHTYVHVHRTQSQQWCTVGGMEQERLARGQVLSQFQQMEEQLCAIESTARMVEGELKASNKVCTYIRRRHGLLVVH